VFSYSHSREKLEQFARDAGMHAKPGTPGEATTGADAVILAVHCIRIDDVLAQAGKLSGTTVNGSRSSRRAREPPCDSDCLHLRLP
jgi:predicted dinucleotide-binding enzyme